MDLVGPPLGVLHQQLRHRLAQQHVDLGDGGMGCRPGGHVARLVGEAEAGFDRERHARELGADRVDQPLALTGSSTCWRITSPLPRS